MTLALIPTDAMVAELKRRYPVMAFAASTSFTEECDLDVAAWNGPPVVVNFMLDVMKRELMDDYLDDADDVDDTL